MNEFSKIWAEYLRIIKSRIPSFPIELNQGILNPQLTKIEEDNFKLPSSLKSLLQINNGQTLHAPPILFGFRLLSINDILTTLKNTSTELIPFAKNKNSTEILAIDLSQQGKIISYNNKLKIPIAESLADFLLLLIDHIQFGFYYYDDKEQQLSIVENEPLSTSLHREYIEQIINNPSTITSYKSKNKE